MTPSYPGITSIGYLLANNLPANTTYQALAGITINLFIRPTPIQITNTAQCVVEHTNDCNGTAERLTLTFSTAQSLPRHTALAFVITDANHHQWLIGQAEQPHLAITATQQTGTPSDTPATYLYEIKTTAPIALKPCKVMV